jgi:hypothetical protein
VKSFDVEKYCPVRLDEDSILRVKSGWEEKIVIEPYENPPIESSTRKLEAGDSNDLMFLAELFSARTPDNCDGKDCKYQSPWCFAGSHEQVYSGVFNAGDESAPIQEKLARRDD